MTDDIRPEDIELGEELEPVIRNRAPVVAVRMSPDLFARLGDYASARNLSVSEVVRQGVERMLGGATAGAAGIVSTGDFIPSSTYAAAPTSAQSSARSMARDVVDESATDLALTA
jgi:hypothetical protein